MQRAGGIGEALRFGRESPLALVYRGDHLNVVLVCAVNVIRNEDRRVQSARFHKQSVRVGDAMQLRHCQLEVLARTKKKGPNM